MFLVVTIDQDWKLNEFTSKYMLMAFIYIVTFIVNFTFFLLQWVLVYVYAFLLTFGFVADCQLLDYIRSTKLFHYEQITNL